MVTRQHISVSYATDETDPEAAIVAAEQQAVDDFDANTRPGLRHTIQSTALTTPAPFTVEIHFVARPQIGGDIPNPDEVFTNADYTRKIGSGEGLFAPDFGRVKR